MLRTIRDIAFVFVANHLTNEAANRQRSQAHSLHCLEIAPFSETTSLHTFLRLRNLALATFWARTVRRTALTRSLYWLFLRVGLLRRRSSRSRRRNSPRNQPQKDAMGIKSAERSNKKKGAGLCLQRCWAGLMTDEQKILRLRCPKIRAGKSNETQPEMEKVTIHVTDNP